MEGADATQVALMEELCIVVNEKDEILGYESKKTCHLMENINKGLLHRAFSVFLFDSKGRLLMQQRSDDKITFPGFWTNTVCSHPIFLQDGVAAKTYGEGLQDEVDGVDGVKRAARRKVKHELGITGITEEDFTYLTRLHYLAPSDGTWGEHEMDYILFVQKDVSYEINPNEVKDVKYVTQDELKTFFARTDVTFTPWFRLITQNFIYKWWDALLDGSLKSHVDETTIHKP